MDVLGAELPSLSEGRAEPALPCSDPAALRARPLPLPKPLGHPNPRVYLTLHGVGLAGGRWMRCWGELSLGLPPAQLWWPRGQWDLAMEAISRSVRALGQAQHCPALHHPSAAPDRALQGPRCPHGPGHAHGIVTVPCLPLPAAPSHLRERLLLLECLVPPALC